MSLDAKGLTTQERFDRYHSAHPEVYSWLVTHARDLQARGWNKYSLHTLIYTCRFHLNTSPDNSEEYKINNDYNSRYARLIMTQEEGLQGFFDIREMKSV